MSHEPLQNCVNEGTVYKVVLTGGPCGGKTTAQDRLAVFFENLGWKVFRPPETATLLFRGGIVFNELNDEQVVDFQDQLLKTVIQIENVYVKIAQGFKNQNCLLVFDRGVMDGSAYISSAIWNRILKRNHFNCVDLRDNRYDQVVHMVTAADGADKFYQVENNATRYEGIVQAIQTDLNTRQAWVGHPYVDIIDNKNCKNFEEKILKLIQVICDRAGVQYGDRLMQNSKKRKFLISYVDESKFPKYEVFDVVHSYLLSSDKDVQVRIRKRGQNGVWSYTHTIRKIDEKGEKVETRMQIGQRQYHALRKHADPKRLKTRKKRRCFLYDQQYFQLDIYSSMPNGFGCLMILETYTTNVGSNFKTPNFLTVDKEVTGDPIFSLYNLSLRKKTRENSTSSMITVSTKQNNVLPSIQDQMSLISLDDSDEDETDEDEEDDDDNHSVNAHI